MAFCFDPFSLFGFVLRIKGKIKFCLFTPSKRVGGVAADLQSFLTLAVHGG
jgi:hypothetical protein